MHIKSDIILIVVKEKNKNNSHLNLLHFDLAKKLHKNH